LSRFGCYGITPARVRERETLSRVCGHVWTPPVWPCGSKAVGSFFSFLIFIISSPPAQLLCVCVCVCVLFCICVRVVYVDAMHTGSST
jgi:hypothetical protein